MNLKRRSDISLLFSCMTSKDAEEPTEVPPVPPAPANEVTSAKQGGGGKVSFA